MKETVRSLDDGEKVLSISLSFGRYSISLIFFFTLNISVKKNICQRAVLNRPFYLHCSSLISICDLNFLLRVHKSPRPHEVRTLTCSAGLTRAK